MKRAAAAVDIGTTTLRAAMKVGDRIYSATAFNPQRVFGADVMSRLSFLLDGAFEPVFKKMRTPLVGAIISLLAKVADEAGDEVTIDTLVFAGNTIMQHFVAGLDPRSMAYTPYIPSTYFVSNIDITGEISVELAEALPCFALGNDGRKPTTVRFAPCFSAFLGGDAMCGLMTSGFDEKTEKEGSDLFIDFGTNGEMALRSSEGDEQRLLLCSAAAGPAFEADGMACGMAGIKGAVRKVWFEDGKPRIEVIGDEKPIGICGTGYISIAAALLNEGIMGENGRFDRNAPCVEFRPRGQTNRNARVYFAPGVFVTEGDMSVMMLAKAAIASGICVLMNTAGIASPDRIMLAGNFGSDVDAAAARRVGLIPPSGEVVTYSGEATLNGALQAAAAPAAAEQRFLSLLQEAHVVTLSTTPGYDEVFSSCCRYNGAPWNEE